MALFKGCRKPKQKERFLIERKPAAFNSLPNDKILDRSKFKTFADNKIHVTENFKFVLGRVENTVGKGEIAGYQHFLLSPQCFPKGSSENVKITR